jgi:hypothetical protein
VNYSGLHTFVTRRWAELRVNEISQDMVNRGEDCRPFQKRMFVKIVSEAHWNEGFRELELFWKNGFGNIEGIGEDVMIERLGPELVQWKDSVVAMGHPSASINALPPYFPPNPFSDTFKCAPPPRPDMVTPLTGALEERIAALETRVTELEHNKVDKGNQTVTFNLR